MGPVYWREGPERSAELLASAYRRSLEVADEHHVRSIAFPSISTGAYGYPMERAAPVALGTVIDYLQRAREEPVALSMGQREESGEIQVVRFVLWGSKAYGVYRQALSSIASDSRSALRLL